MTPHTINEDSARHTTQGGPTAAQTVLVLVCFFAGPIVFAISLAVLSIGILYDGAQARPALLGACSLAAFTLGWLKLRGFRPVSWSLLLTQAAMLYGLTLGVSLLRMYGARLSALPPKAAVVISFSAILFFGAGLYARRRTRKRGSARRSPPG